MLVLWAVSVLWVFCALAVAVERWDARQRRAKEHRLFHLNEQRSRELFDALMTSGFPDDVPAPSPADAPERYVYIGPVTAHNHDAFMEDARERGTLS